MAVSVRIRFEVFKRDEFTCLYCGRKSPDVVLEVDHIVPVCEGGGDDVINLRTSCWECNRGKGGVPLAEVVTGEDPHDRAILLIERERQLREYNHVLAEIRLRKEAEAEDLLNYWSQETGKDAVTKMDWGWLLAELDKSPAETIRHAMTIAIGQWKIRDWRYVGAIVRNWREEGKP